MIILKSSGASISLYPIGKFSISSLSIILVSLISFGVSISLDAVSYKVYANLTVIEQINYTIINKRKKVL